MYCANCGKKINAKTGCPDCINQKKKTNIGWFFLGLFIPFIGIILFCIWRKERKEESRNLLIGFFCGIALYVILFTYMFYYLIATIINGDHDFCEFECPNGFKSPENNRCICPGDNYFDFNTI